MDDYKQAMTSRVGVGGLHCTCCNDFKGKDKSKLNRRARRSLKQKDKTGVTDEVPDGTERQSL